MKDGWQQGLHRVAHLHKLRQGTGIYEMDQLVRDTVLHVNDAREGKNDF